MKLIYTISFIIIFTFPIYSQNNKTTSKVSSKLNLNYSDENLQVDLMTQNKLERFYKNLKSPNKDKNHIKIIPIPPATFLNSKAELLPLHRPGDVIMKFVNKKLKNNNTQH